MNRLSAVSALMISTVTLVAVSCGGGSESTATSGQGGATASSSASKSSSSATASSSSTGGSGGAAPCLTNDGTTFALTKLDFGPGSNGEWKKIGLNVDGLASTGASKDVCQPNAGGDPQAAYPDGDNGIDNSFGKNLLPLIIGVDPPWQDNVNISLKNGLFNALLKLYCLPPAGDAKVTAKLFGGTDLMMMPKYDGTDVWPVAPELLADPKDPESSTIVFANGAVAAGKYDSGKGQTVILTLPVAYNGMATTMKLTLYAAEVSMTLSADRKSATGGMIGGVLNTEEFIDQINKLGWVFGVCGQPTLDQVRTLVRQASDIMSDGTQDPAKTCDAISIGIAFEMKEVQRGDVGPVAAMGMACP